VKYIIEISDRDAEKIEKMKEVTDDLYITDHYDERTDTLILDIAPYRE
jgi:hypothetical protein